MADEKRTGAERPALDWEDARFFAALARHGSLSATARALGVNHATVARRISGMEQALGTRLFERRPDGYVLTQAGHDALEAADAMEKAARRLFHRREAHTLSGLVRIGATPSLADAYLVPRLPLLAERHPGIDVEIASDRRLASLSRREVDIALRLGAPKDGAAVARRLVTVSFGFYASAAWRARLDAGEAPVFAGFDEANAHLPEAAWLARHFPGARLALRANTQLTQALAARAGLAIALVPHFIAAAEPSLVRLDLGRDPPARDLFLLTNRLAPEDSAVRAVRDLLAKRFAADAALFTPPDA